MIYKEVQFRNYPYKSRTGLAERIVKGYFEKRGFEVYRGIRTIVRQRTLRYFLYENVKRAYDRVETIIREHLQDRHREFVNSQSLKGMPDFIIHRKYPGKMTAFVEVKFEHESIKKHQKDCLAKLESFGFVSMIVRVKSKVRTVEILDNGKAIIQQKLRLHYPKTKNNLTSRRRKNSFPSSSPPTQNKNSKPTPSPHLSTHQKTTCQNAQNLYKPTFMF